MASISELDTIRRHPNKGLCHFRVDHIEGRLAKYGPTVVETPDAVQRVLLEPVAAQSNIWL